ENRPVLAEDNALTPSLLEQRNLLLQPARCGIIDAQPAVAISGDEKPAVGTECGGREIAVRVEMSGGFREFRGYAGEGTADGALSLDTFWRLDLQYPYQPEQAHYRLIVVDSGERLVA